MKGNIRVKCYNCHNKFRLEVDFPKDNEGFTDTYAVCPHCDTNLYVYDPHIYNEDGSIKEEETK